MQRSRPRERGGLLTAVGFRCSPRDCLPTLTAISLGLTCSLVLMVKLLWLPQRDYSQRRKGRLCHMMPYSSKHREEGPSLPPPAARKGRVGFMGLGSDPRVVTRPHRGWPSLIPHRGSQARVSSRGEAVGILGHPSLCPAGGPGSCWEGSAVCALLRTHSTRQGLGRAGCSAEDLFCCAYQG